MKVKILIADDHAATRKSIKMLLIGEPYDCLEATTLEDTYEKIVHDWPDLVLLDIHFQNNETSIQLLKRLASEQIKVPIIILSGAASASEAAESIKFGAYDYLEKPISGERLKVTLGKCLQYSQVKRHLDRVLIHSNAQSHLIGKSESIQKLQRQIERFAPKNVKVLITGETGTGKEVVANSLWQASLRRDKPFIIVNSAAIPETLIESELFGHKRGAFTGASNDQMGKIEMADGGTLFLDEVGELSLSAQSKLLRFLETGELQKVGSSELKKVDVRLIAATSRNLEEEIKNEHFRSDLYYRLNVVHLILPPLRERGEDIALLFAHFVDSFCKKYEEPPKLIEREALELLETYDWPGNIRELRNLAEKAVVVSEQRILKESVKEMLPHAKAPSKRLEAKLTLREFKSNAERDYILAVLESTQGSVTESAKVLGIDRTYLHQKMNQLKIS